MEFRIADTFTASLDELTRDEQKAVKTTAFDLQGNPARPGLQFHELDRAKDKSFWSVRVSRDIRLIVHKTDASLLLCEEHVLEPCGDSAGCGPSITASNFLGGPGARLADQPRLFEPDQVLLGLVGPRLSGPPEAANAAGTPPSECVRRIA